MRALRALSKMRVLCVAEKPSISKAVAEHLSGGTQQAVSPMAFVLSTQATESLTPA